MKTNYSNNKQKDSVANGFYIRLDSLFDSLKIVLGDLNKKMGDKLIHSGPGYNLSNITNENEGRLTELDCSRNMAIPPTCVSLLKHPQKNMGCDADHTESQKDGGH